MEQKRVSISQVLLVINGGPPQEMDPELARRGIAAHKKIEKEVTEGKIPSSLVRAGLRPPITPEKTIHGNIGGTELSGRIDLVGEGGMVVDLKPGADIKGRHLFQAAMAARAHGSGKAAVYLYGAEGTYLITDGGQSAGKEIGVVVTNARRILENEAEMKNKRKTLGPAGMQQKGTETVRLRQELERNLNVAMEKIKSKLVKYQ